MHPYFGEWPNGVRWPFKSSSLGGAVWEATPPLGSHALFVEATPLWGEATPPFIRGGRVVQPHFGEWPNGVNWPFKFSFLGGAEWEATPPLGSHAPFHKGEGSYPPILGSGQMGCAGPLNLPPWVVRSGKPRPLWEATPPFIRGRGRTPPFWGVAKWGALAL